MTKNYPKQDNNNDNSNDEDNKSFDLNCISLSNFPTIPLHESLGFFNQLDEEQENSINNQLLNYLYNIEIPDNITPKEKRTAFFTDINTSTLFFSYEKIKDQLKDDSFNKYTKIMDNCKKINEINEIKNEMKLITKKRKKYGEKVDTKDLSSKFIRGRKKAEDQTKRAHNKKSPDNIIKKIKGYFIEFLITFVNSIINKKEYKLKSLDYRKYINRLKREEDLNLLKMTVKDYLSQDISPKYIKTETDWNRIKIKAILNGDKNNQAIKFVFSMTIKDWIELFTLKKKIYDFENLKDLSLSEQEEIQSKIPSIKKVFDDILDKNKDDSYFTKFVFYLYNYEKWFLSKSGRNREKRI